MSIVWSRAFSRSKRTPQQSKKVRFPYRYSAHVSVKCLGFINVADCQRDLSYSAQAEWHVSLLSRHCFAPLPSPSLSSDRDLPIRLTWTPLLASPRPCKTKAPTLIELASYSE